jgi:DNA-binding XRE family transcriptional regulator
LRTNPAYEDYCFAQNISVNERNPIILLGSIGKKGPSSFIFEPVYDNPFTSVDIVKIREILDISQHDLAKAFGLSEITVKKIESRKSQDATTLKLIQMFFTFPECGLWQLKQTGSRVHSAALLKLTKYFQNELG